MIQLLLLSLFAFVSLDAKDAKQFSPDQKKEIEGIIHDYIINNPEILTKAVEVLKERQYQQMQQNAVNAIVKEAQKVFASNSPFIGNKDGQIYIVEFMDYNCPHCREIHNTLSELISENKDLKLVIKEFPVLGPDSVYAAKAALAAAKQGKFQQLHDAFLSEKVKLTESKILDIASDLNIDVSLLLDDMKKVEPELNEVRNLATSIGIIATPALIVATYPIKDEKKVLYIPGAVQKPVFEKAIEAVK
jgi:protein-disulfide isomerase